ncbi:MAG: DMT family transporter [Tissierellia bacterium]|nr:DMT family transporter [Tissierellia bacterium]
MDKKKLTSNILLLITSIIWGAAFVAQRKGMDSNGPFTFITSRYVLSAIFIYFFRMIYLNKNPELKIRKASKKTTMMAMISCGMIMFIATTLQQAGMLYTTAGKAAFITCLYIVLIPIISVFIGKRITIIAWIAVILGTIGLALLTLKENLTMGKGDLLVFIGAFFWASHILAVDHFLSKGVEAMDISFGQLVTVALCSAVAMFALETPTLSGIYDALPSILFAGIMSGGLGYTFQVLAQKNTEPVVASLIMSLESVFGAITGYLFLKEIMTTREILGCIIAFVAVIISQIPIEKFKGGTYESKN